MSNKQTNLIWIDLEMSGLNPLQDKILEIATVVTDSQLNIVDQGPELVIYQPEDVLARMDEWNTEHHSRSGLVDRVRQSQISERDAERQTLEFVYSHVAEKASPMCGNSICQDRRFLNRYMPTLERYFHYRHLDVSTLKILAKNWMPDILQAYKKSSNHRALEDVIDSIQELKFYRQHLLHPACTKS